MIEAMYGVEFVSNRQDAGYGVVVFESGRIFGGDSSCVYIGDYSVHDGAIRANVRVTNDRGTMQSIFGPIKEFTVTGEGKIAHNEFILSGRMKEHPDMTVTVKFTRRAELP